MTNPALDFKFLRGISQILAWFLNSYVGFHKSSSGFQIPAREMTNPALDFKIQRRISQILACFLNSNAGNPKSRVGRRRRHRGALRLWKTREERSTHGVMSRTISA